MPERYITESEENDSNQEKRNQTAESYKNITDMLSPDARGDDYITQDINDVSVEEVKESFYKLVADNSFPNQVSVSSILISEPNHIADIYDSMSFIPSNCPLTQEVLFIKSGEKILTYILVGADRAVFTRLTTLENSERFLQDSYSQINREQEAIINTERLLLEKSLYKVMKRNATGYIDISLRKSNLENLNEYVEYFQEKFNRANPQERLTKAEAEIEGDHHFQIATREWGIGSAYLPAEEKVTIQFIQKNKDVFVILPTLDENLKVRVYGKNLASSGDLIKGIWYNMQRKK